MGHYSSGFGTIVISPHRISVYVIIRTCTCVGADVDSENGVACSVGLFYYIHHREKACSSGLRCRKSLDSSHGAYRLFDKVPCQF